MYLIQIRKMNNKRLSAEDIINGFGSPEDWSNQPTQYRTIKEAIKECESLISCGQRKAHDIRIVEVVCTFESEVKVKVNERKA